MRRERATLLLVLATVFALSLAAPVFARQASSITGRVIDPRGAGVAGAVVTVYSRETGAVRRSTTTNESGAFVFERLAPGEYLLEVEARGFARGAARSLALVRGAAASLEVQLEVAGLRDEVLVVAADAPQTTAEVSKAATVVGRDELERRDEFLIADALRTVPGLRVQQLGGPGSLVTIKSRGLRNQDTAVLIDGLRLRDPSTPQGDATGLLSELLVTNTSSVEVLRGTGSPLYGTGAVGGVVNVVTEEGGGPFRGNLLFEGGGLGLARGQAQVSGGAGRADRLAFSAGASHLNVSRGVDGDDAARNTSAQARALFRLVPTATLSARLYAADSFTQLNENPLVLGTLPAAGVVEATPLAESELRRFESGASFYSLNAGGATFIPAPNDPDASRALRFFSGAFTFAHRPAEQFGYQVTYHALATRSRFADGPAAPGTPSDFIFFEPAGTARDRFSGRIHTLDARTDFRLGRANHVTAGYEFETESFTNVSSRNGARLSATSVSERSHALFVRDQVRLLDDRLHLSAAFRAQFFKLDAPSFEPSASAPYGDITFVSPRSAYTGDASVAYLFRSTGTKLRGHAGNAYRKPSLYERFGSFYSSFSARFSPLGDPRLAPERSVGFDLGLDQTFGDDRARLSATYFYARLQEVVGFGATPNDPFGRLFGGFINTGGGLSRGLELSGAFAPSSTLDLHASYTYTNSDQRNPVVAGVIRSFAIPEHQFALAATQRFGRRAFVNFDLLATSDYLAPIFDQNTFRTRAFRFDGALKADVTASYTLPLSESRRLRFFGKVENLFDREYYENGFRTPGPHGRAGAAFSF